ncbi:MAG: hypothetical protein GX341_08610 [Firmicutes bacterium]|mgnify:CR=1 FL=1|nr:hypothetical protein [Bacillota bacterium]
MSGATFNPSLVSLAGSALCCFFTGIAVKLMDDYLDAHFDQMAGKRTWAGELGEAALPYALAALSLGAAFNPAWSLTLFWASYAMGMRGDMTRPLSLGLTGWQEALVLGVFALLVFGWKEVFTSWGAIFVLQAIDDLRDEREDRLTSAGNWAVQWGVVETGLTGVLMAIILARLDLWKLVLVLSAGLVAAAVQESKAVGGGQASG